MPGWIVTLNVLVLGLNIVNSRYGRVMRAIHFSQSAAESVGVVVHQYKAQIFALSAAFASIAGTLYARFQAAVIPATFGFGESLELDVDPEVWLDVIVKRVPQEYIEQNKQAFWAGRMGAKVRVNSGQ